MFDWTVYTKDPSDTATTRQLQSFLASLQSFFTGTRNDFLKSYVHGARVLDIGAGEHDASCYNEERWEHGIICKSAAYAMGIDLNPEVCKHYNEKGFRFTCIDATSDAYLGEQFDLVFIGDVIEHVNNPVALLQFAKRHLTPGGHILVTTPNPYCLSYLTARFKRKNRPFFMANMEHISWITPTNANEIARRAQVTFSKIYYPKNEWSQVRTLKQFFKTLIEKKLHFFGLHEIAHKEFIYEFQAT